MQKSVISLYVAPHFPQSPVSIAWLCDIFRSSGGLVCISVNMFVEIGVILCRRGVVICHLAADSAFYFEAVKPTRNEKKIHIHIAFRLLNTQNSTCYIHIFQHNILNVHRKMLSLINIFILTSYLHNISPQMLISELLTCK